MFEITKIKYSKTITSLRESQSWVLLYHAKFDFQGGYLSRCFFCY